MNQDDGGGLPIKSGGRSYSLFRHFWSIFRKKNPIHLTIFLTRRCNQRCSFCFCLAADASSDTATNGATSLAPVNLAGGLAGSAGSAGLVSAADLPASPPTFSDSELSLAELTRIADSCPPLLWLAFSGGEIFLRSDLVDIAVAFYRRTRPAVILFPTNGLSTERIVGAMSEIVRSCPRSTVVVKLSLDGPAATHDRLRGVAGSHAACLRTAVELGKLQDDYRNFELGVNSVFCPATQDSMQETIDFVAQLPYINTHTISLARGALADQSQLVTDLEKYRQAGEYLATKLKTGQARTYRFGGARLKAAQDILQRRYILETARQQRALLPCYAGRLNLVITDTGETYPCENFQRKMRLGNIRACNGDLVRLLQTTRVRQVLSAIKSDGCFCTHECFMMTNILFNPTTYPALLKEYKQL